MHQTPQHPRDARRPNAAGADWAAVDASRNQEGENDEDRRHQLYRHRLAVAGGRHAAGHRHGGGAKFRARAAARPHQPDRLRQPRRLRHGLSALAGAEGIAARALSVLDLRHRLADHADRPLLHGDERAGAADDRRLDLRPDRRGAVRRDDLDRTPCARDRRAGAHRREPRPRLFPSPHLVRSEMRPTAALTPAWTRSFGRPCGRTGLRQLPGTGGASARLRRRRGPWGLPARRRDEAALPRSWPRGSSVTPP